MTTVKFYRATIDDLLRERDALAKQVRNEARYLKDAGTQLDAVEKSQAVVQEIAQQIQQVAHAQVASVVSRCLRAVFGDEAYEFRILFEQKRGRTEATLVLRRGDVVLDDPLHEAGGGVIDVASFALRLACLLLARPHRRRLLVLDEPFKHLDKENQQRAGLLLQSLAEELGVQFVIVTHSDYLKVGKVIEL